MIQQKVQKVYYLIDQYRPQMHSFLVLFHHNHTINYLQLNKVYTSTLIRLFDVQARILVQFTKDLAQMFALDFLQSEEVNKKENLFFKQKFNFCRVW